MAWASPDYTNRKLHLVDVFTTDFVTVLTSRGPATLSPRFPSSVAARAPVASRRRACRERPEEIENFLGRDLSGFTNNTITNLGKLM